jgi:hypothetical protein
MTDNATATVAPVVTDLAKGPEATATVAPIVEMVKPKEVDELCEILSISPVLSKDGKDYHIVTFFNTAGNKQTTAISASLKSVVADITAAVGKMVNVTFSRNIANKTQWLDKTTGALSFHTKDAVNLVRLSATTKSQADALAIEAKFALAGKLGLEKRISEANTDDKVAFANLYGSMMRS